ncbi:MAG: hypothetical protein N2376_00395, partial [Clostridia bacterium]|nr:hypothetical protein [Clostridia bacterium]
MLLSRKNNACLADMKGLARYSAPWDTLTSYYMHSEYDAVLNPQKVEKRAQELDAFRDTYNYNFMSENQLAKTMAATHNTNVNVQSKLLLDLFYKV